MRTPAQHRADITRASGAIADLAAEEPDRPVPTCPGWDLGDLARHVAVIQRWATDILRTMPDTRPERDDSGPTGAAAAEFLRGTAAELEAALRDADLDSACWGFGPDRTAGFWSRRQAQEALMHLHDASAAVGPPTEIPAEAAVEGVTEFLDSFVASWWKFGDWGGDGETCHLHATDAEGEWLLTLTAQQPRLEFGHAKGDVAVRGAAEALLLGVWGRAPMEHLEWFGADADVSRWRERLTSTQV